MENRNCIHDNSHCISEHVLHEAVDKCVPSSLIASGCSVNVYCVEIDSELSVIKELYPIGLNEQHIISRSYTYPYKVLFKKNLYACNKWVMARRRFYAAYRTNNNLQKENALSDFIVPVHSLIRKNGTMYTISLMAPGIPLDKEKLTPEAVLLLGAHISENVELIHQKGWILVDIKAANFILYPHNKKSVIRLTDFDSAIPINQIRATRMFMCSNETASPEMLHGDSPSVGTHSDVYSIASMMVKELVGSPVTDDPLKILTEKAKTLLRQWKPAAVSTLIDMLLSALQKEPYKRTQTCKQLAYGLRTVCELEGLDDSYLFH